MKILNLLTGIILAVIIALSAFVSFGLLVYPTNEYAAVILSLILVFALSFFLDKLRRHLFRLTPSKLPWNAILSTALIAGVMIFIFWIPAGTFTSTNSPDAEKYGIEPELIPIHTGDQVAVYVHEPDISNEQYPILFLAGGPGGYPTHSVKEYLDEYAKLGYTVYAYDPIGVRESPLPKDTSSYGIAHEVEVVNDIVKHYNINKVNLIASSYGGNVAPRFIAQHPEHVNAYLSVDTAPLYTMSLNYPGQENDTAYYDSLEDTREDAAADSAAAQSIASIASPKQMIRMLYGMNLMKLFKKNDIPYGSYEEYDYFISLLVNTAIGSFSEDGKVTRHMNFLSNILIDDSLGKSPDFTKDLREMDTPPVLVVHPEFGVVPWQCHYQYKEFFSDIHFAIAPGAGHSIWSTPSGRDILIRSGDALFRGNALPDEYTSSENPFPPM